MKRTSKGRGFGDANVNSDNRPPRIEELVEMVKPTSEFLQVRLIGDVFSYATHWIKILTSKGEFNIPKVPLNFDPYSDSFDETIEDPYYDLPNRETTSKRYFVNVIVRDIQDSEPRKKEKPTKSERKSGFMNGKGSKTWTPVRVLSVPSGVAKQLQKIITMNKHKVNGKVVNCELSDPKYGCDLFISFDPDAKGPNKWSVQKGDHSPLTEDEKAYLQWNLDFTETAMRKESLEKAKQEAKALLAKAGQGDDEDEDDDEDEYDLPSKKSKKSKKSKDKKAKKPKDKSSKSDGDKPKKKKKKTKKL